MCAPCKQQGHAFAFACRPSSATYYILPAGERQVTQEEEGFKGKKDALRGILAVSGGAE